MHRRCWSCMPLLLAGNKSSQSRLQCFDRTVIVVYHCVHYSTCMMYSPGHSGFCKPQTCRFLLKNSSDGSDGNNSSSYDLPMECPSQGPRPCTGTNFRPVDDGPGSACYTNHQELRVQQQLQCLEPGSVPASISVVVQDELADSCQPGGTNSNLVTSVMTLYMHAATHTACRQGGAVLSWLMLEAADTCCCCGARILCRVCCR
jgi:hypothetical protein